jgi:tRNA threonylcarbamoyladenosine modification (KEOPS) complex  Pcc1 subunit
MRAIAEALEPEISHPAGERAQVRILMRGTVLKMHFEARDTASLRAAMTSYLRMLGAAVNVSRSILNLEGKGDRK